MTPHEVTIDNAPRIWDWLMHRGGLAVWGCLDLADPAKTWTSPLNTADGSPTTKPHGSATVVPIRTITDPAEVTVVVPQELERFHVSVRIGGQGFKVKLTDASTAKLRKRVAHWNEVHEGGSWYAFDYETQEAVIFGSSKRAQPIAEWAAAQL